MKSSEKEVLRKAAVEFIKTVPLTYRVQSRELLTRFAQLLGIEDDLFLDRRYYNTGPSAELREQKRAQIPNYWVTYRSTNERVAVTLAEAARLFNLTEGSLRTVASTRRSYTK